MQTIRNLSYLVKINGTELAEKLGIDTETEHVDKVDVKINQGLVEVTIACTVTEEV